MRFAFFAPVLPTAWITLALFSAQTLAAQQKTMAPADFIAWLPITDADRNQKAPSVDPDAGAEIILWRVHVVDEYTGQDLQRVLYHYIRLKIFSEKGKEAATTVDLPYREPGAILSVSGRTIKADGTITELESKTIYRRDLVRAGGRKQRVVSFAMPGVEPGAIVEYRWKQTQDDNRFRYLRLNFARELPVQKVTYFVRPLTSEYVATDQMFLAPFNCKPSPIKPTNDGWNETSLENVAATREEPYTPSDPNLEPWALLYYREGGARNPEKYWSDQGKKAYNELKAALKSSDEQKAAATKAVAGANTDEQKIAALVTYVRQALRSLSDPQIPATDREAFLKKLPKDRYRTSAEILKGTIATSDEMNIAFAALAMQAGLDARPALVGDRGELQFSPELADRYFLDNIAMAVKVGTSWKVVDVSRRNLTPGMLPWNEEGVAALITDAKAPMFVTTTVSEPEASLDSRTAKLKLSVNGGLSGDVEETYTGHRAEQYRQELGRMSPAQREEWLHDRTVQMFPGSEVTALKVENIDDPSKPVQASYHLEAPLFAQVTGKRILIQPSVFRRAQAPLFPASERHKPVQFPFAWKEVDNISLVLPVGFSLENPDSPGSLAFGDTGGYKLEIRIKTGALSELTLSRELTLGNKGLFSFRTDAYPTLKKIFDEVHLRDSHSMALKED